jgi:triacylglycerol lipase
MVALTTPQLRAPIVLVHGLLGFDRLKLFGWTLASYFTGIPEFLAGAGNRVGVARLSPTGGVAERAAQLKAFLDREYPGEPVHLLAHSMGGLDSRYMISRLDMAERVLSLTTLGTPHRGSTFADWGLHRLECLAKPFLEATGIPHQAFYDLTTSRCREFNESVPDAAGVRYFSVAGREANGRSPLSWHFVSMPIVTEKEGPNDGIVSVASATYGESIDVWDGDHLSLVNWTHPAGGAHHDRTSAYASLVRRLADEGY